MIGRDPKRTGELASRFGVQRTATPAECDPELDLLLIAVSDDAIREVGARLPPMEGVIAHCSGVQPLSLLEGCGRGQGVFYPVQTFSESEVPEWASIPICIEGSDPGTEERLLSLASGLSDVVQRLSGDERRYLHLAAVFACNFSNHLFGIAKEILGEHEIPYELLRALILRTASKGVENDPREVQTGPAARGDRETMKQHLALLEKEPDLQELYERISQRILNEQHGRNEL